MKIIGLTGPSGTGKSSVARAALALGFFVIDCDKVAAEVRSLKTTARAVQRVFPRAIKNGKIDKAALAMAAFETKESTEKLNALMLPIIIKEMDKRILAAEKEGFKYCLLDAPTLYESGADKRCSAVLAVLAREEIRKARIAKRDNISGEMLKRRLAAAKPDSYYTAKTGHIIYNNGSEEELYLAAEKILNKLKEI